ncbi:MAG: diguanylate cyclase [Spirochaetes bacterium]|jgi:diguanylate cyclase (GGDEF)-like protein|nr:diguanylate cyclase [Spirochaetota bacterium]
MNSIYYTSLLLISVFLLFILLATVWPKRRLAESRYLLGIIIGSIVWSCSVAIENSVSGMNGKIFWSTIAYLGIISNPVFLFFFILEYCNVDHNIKNRYLPLFWVIPVFTIVAVCTNSFHNLVWSRFSWSNDILVYWYGPLFWLIVIYSYMLLVAAILILCNALLRMQGVYKRQLLMLLVASVFPFLANAMYVTKLEPFVGFDFTPIAFMLSSAMLIFVFLRFNFLDLIPVAHHQVFSHIKAGIMILDGQNRIIEFNENMQKQLNAVKLLIGFEISDLPEDYSMIRDVCLQNSFYENEIMIRSTVPEYYDMSINEIFNANHVLSGKIVMLYDITHQKSAEKQLKRSNNLLKDRLFEIERLQEKLREQALKDPLTGLYNRRFLYDGIDKEISRAKREKDIFAVAMFDIDNFKKINDLYGHNAGDKVLVAIASLIEISIRKTDYVCRFNGDTLVIILTKISAEDINRKINIVKDEIRKMEFPSITDGLRVVVATGYAFYPENGMTYDELFVSLEQAVGRSKSENSEKSFIPDRNL